MAEQSRPPKPPDGKPRQKRKPYQGYATPVIPEVKRNRVARIRFLMTRQLWDRGETEKELAAEWGVAVATVQNMATEAARWLDLNLNDRVETEKYCRARLREIAEMDGPDRVPAINTILKNAGLLSEKHEVQISQLPDRDVVLQAVRQALEIPEWREIIRAELARYEVPLLTEGVGIDE